jgi:hypothetical protein
MNLHFSEVPRMASHCIGDDYQCRCCYHDGDDYVCRMAAEDIWGGCWYLEESICGLPLRSEACIDSERAAMEGES